MTLPKCKKKVTHEAHHDARWWCGPFSSSCNVQVVPHLLGGGRKHVALPPVETRFLFTWGHVVAVPKLAGVLLSYRTTEVVVNIETKKLLET